MLAVNNSSFSPEMEPISEQDLVEHCVIVEPSGSTTVVTTAGNTSTSHSDGVPHPSEVDLEVEVEHGLPPSPPPPPPPTTTTRIVYSHSARLAGGQLVTVLTHGDHAPNFEEPTTAVVGGRLVVVVPNGGSSGSGGSSGGGGARLQLKGDHSHHHPTVLVHTSPHSEPGGYGDSATSICEDSAQDLSLGKQGTATLATLTVIVPPSSSSSKLVAVEDHHHQSTGEEGDGQGGETETEMICDEFRHHHGGHHGHHHNPHHHTHPHHLQHHQLDPHQHHAQHHHQVVTVVGYPNGGRTTPTDSSDYGGGSGGGGGGGSGSAGQYATLTPLQPLPPISTMTDKFTTYAPGYNGVSVMGGYYENAAAVNVKLMSPQGNPGSGHGYAASPNSHNNNNNNNGLSPPQGYSSGGSNGLPSPKGSPSTPYRLGSPTFTALTTTTITSSSSSSNTSSGNNNSNNASNGLSPHHDQHQHPSSPQLAAVVVAHRDASSPSLLHPHITKAIAMVTTTSTPAGSGGSSTSSQGGGASTSSTTELEEINTKELAARISAELKRYSIPQAIFAQRVLCRSQGTLSDLLRNPKPWSKLKSGRETFRRMWKWLQEPEFQRMSALRLAGQHKQQGKQSSNSGPACGYPVSMTPNTSSPMAEHHPFPVDIESSTSYYNASGGIHGGGGSQNHHACKRKEEQGTTPEHPPTPKKPRLVFTDLQRRTLQAIFKETKRPSKEMQVTIARQLGLEPTTVGNFFMNARRRSMDKWKEENEPSPKSNASSSTPNGVHGEHNDHEHDAL